MSTVDQILARWPLDSMLVRCNIAVPERGKFCSPFRPDNNPSCEIYGEKIYDRSTGESYDSIGVFAEHKGISNSEAIKQLAAELPGREPKLKPEPHKLVVPPLHYTLEEAKKVAALRGLSPLGVEMAGFFLATLRFGKVGGFDCWILTDASNRIAEARRMDGEMFPAIGSLGERKAHTLRGSCKSWPLGLQPPKVKRIPADFPCVLVEGGPDYLAACDLIAQPVREFLPVSMLGAAQSIHAEALPFFRGRKVLIVAHPDDAGRASANRWRNQLTKAGAIPIARELQGGDLNDLCKQHGARTVAAELIYEAFA